MPDVEEYELEVGGRFTSILHFIHWEEREKLGDAAVLIFSARWADWRVVAREQ